MTQIDALALQALLGRHLAMYRTRVPHYQTTMLNTLLDVWSGPHATLLDIGAGTGVIAEAVKELFPIEHVEAVDLIDRFCPGLSIPFGRFDGRTLPYADATFDAAMLNNVVHHVPVGARVHLLREIRRVVRGALYIKDHERRGRADTMRLTVLDAIGNIPFGGMVRARYLTRGEWEQLAADTGYSVAARTNGRYRSGLFSALFPNRLETTMRLDPIPRS